MQSLMPRTQTLAILARWAYGVSITFLVALIITFTATLGHALGGDILAYAVALALAGALSILVLFVLAFHNQPTTPVPSMNGATTVRQRDEIAA